MPYRIWFIASFPTPLFFRYHLPLRVFALFKKKSNYKFERHPEIWADSWLFMQKNLCWGVFAPGESALSAISILSFKSTEAVEGI